MHRFYCPPGSIGPDKITIADKASVHHIRDVLRLRLKEEVLVFDNSGTQYLACIDSFTANSALLDIKERMAVSARSGAGLTVACAVPKQARMDGLIDAMTQLGVDRIIPLQTSRTIVRLNEQQRDSRLRRWLKIAQSASQQSQRSVLPVIEPIRSLAEAIAGAQEFDLKLILTLAAKARPIRDILDKSSPESILVLVGPEGDFTEQEIAMAEQRGCIPASLGNLVLRVETAALAAVAFLELYVNPAKT